MIVAQRNGADHDTRSMLSLRTASSIDEIRATLAQLDKQEKVVTARLDTLIATQNDLSRHLGRLDLLRAQLGTQVANTRAISNGMLSDAASTASRISGTVKRLDKEQENVKATLEVVEQVVELKACVSGVVGSMGAPQDWETAAGYLSRAAKIPDHVIDGPFAEEIVPSAEVPDAPRVTLENAAESLCGLFLREFEKAVQENDGSRVTRFFKLFPLIGRSEVGLDAYGRYVCQGVSARARSNLNAGTGGAQRKDGHFYGNALTKLFEHIAQIVDAHEPLVERHYGTGSMVRVVERLQMEADVQGGIVLDTWHDERSVSRKLTEVKTYPFSFLVSSFLGQQQKGASIKRSESPMVRNGTPDTQASEDDGVDMKEVDNLLAESALMLGRWALYARFLSSKAPVGTKLSENSKGLSLMMFQSSSPAVNGDSAKAEALSPTLPTYLANSALQRKVNSYLIEPFNTLAAFFFRRSVERAFQIDEAPSGLSLSLSKPIRANAPYIISAVDDVMYILNQVLQRTLSTSQRAVIANVIPTLGRVLTGDFINMIQRKMRDECYPKAAVQGALPPEDKIVAFCVLINSLDISTEYLKRIIAQQLQAAPDAISADETTDVISQAYPFDDDAIFVTKSLRNLETTFTSKASELLGDGINVTFHQVLKPRVRPLLADAFRDVEYNNASSNAAIEDEDADFTDTNTTNLVPRRFAQTWTNLTKPLKRLLTPTAYDKLLALTLPYLAAALEKRIWSLHSRISELGVISLERDVAGIVATACGEGKYSLRDSFERCTQIVMVAGMEAEEWEEMQAEGEDDEGFKWVIDSKEKERARGLVNGR